AACPDRHGGDAGAVHRPEPVTEPVPGRADHRQAVLDVPARLEKRPEDDVLPPVAAGDPDPAGHRHRGSPRRRRRSRGVLPGEPRDLRGLPVTSNETKTPPAASEAAVPRPLLLDPGMDLTLRPMRYPHFYDRFRDAI